MPRDIPELTRWLRGRLGLTQERFAARIDVTYSTVNHWENGRRTPQPYQVRRLRALEAELEGGGGTPSVEASAGGDRPAGGARSLPPAGDAVSSRIRAMAGRIVERFAPRMVILFGSHARGEAGPASDVDLLVVTELTGSKRETQLAIRRALRDFEGPKDVIVTTPRDFEWRRRVVGTIERAASLEGRVLHASG